MLSAFPFCIALGKVAGRQLLSPRRSINFCHKILQKARALGARGSRAGAEADIAVLVAFRSFPKLSCRASPLACVCACHAYALCRTLFRRGANTMEKVIVVRNLGGQKVDLQKKCTEQLKVKPTSRFVIMRLTGEGKDNLSNPNYLIKVTILRL